MKNFITALALLTCPISAQDNDPFGGGGGGGFDEDMDMGGGGQATPAQKLAIFNETVTVRLNESTLEELFEWVAEKMPEAPGVIFKGEAGVRLISMNIKNVTLDNLYQIVETVTDCSVNFIDTDPTDAYPGVVVIEPNEHSDDPFGAPQSIPRTRPKAEPVSITPAPVEAPLLTRTYSVAEFDDFKPADIIDAIQTLWTQSNPDATDSRGRILLHDATKLLIVQATEERHADVASVMAIIPKNNLQNDSNLHRMEARMKLEAEMAERAHNVMKTQISDLMEELHAREIEIARLKAELQGKNEEGH